MTTPDVNGFLARVPLFQGLSPSDINTIRGAMVPRRFSSGESIVHQDDSNGQAFFIIVDGSVDVVVVTAEGKQTALATLGVGEFFGEMSILDGEPRSASVIAAESCELLILQRRDFIRILEGYPAIAIQMLITMSLRLRRSNRHINTLSILSVYGRIADVILQIADERGETVEGYLVINDPPTHQAMADMAGTTRETVTRVLTQLRKKRYISNDRKRLVILDAKKLLD